MKRLNLFHLMLTVILLAGLAHLRSDWLSGAPERPEPAAAEKPEPAAKKWVFWRNEPHLEWSFLRQR